MLRAAGKGMPILLKILIVEDEKKTGEYLTKGLEAGFVVDRR